MNSIFYKEYGYMIEGWFGRNFNCLFSPIDVQILFQYSILNDEDLVTPVTMNTIYEGTDISSVAHYTFCRNCRKVIDTNDNIAITNYNNK